VGRTGTDETEQRKQKLKILFASEKIVCGVRLLLECGGKCRDGVSSVLRLTDQAARSMTAPVGLVASVCQPSTLRMVICPEAVSGDGRTVSAALLDILRGVAA
jgi:hypothetical protein